MIDVRRARIDLEAVLDSVRRDDAGAIVLFVGTVRSDEGIRALDYEVYRPMAIKSDICMGRLRPGQRLHLGEICKEQGVSLSVVREAVALVDRNVDLVGPFDEVEAVDGKRRLRIP